MISALSRACGSTAFADASGEDRASDGDGWDAKALADWRRACRASVNARRPRRTADAELDHVDMVVVVVETFFRIRLALFPADAKVYTRLLQR